MFVYQPLSLRPPTMLLGGGNISVPTVLSLSLSSFSALHPFRALIFAGQFVWQQCARFRTAANDFAGPLGRLQGFAMAKQGGDAPVGNAPGTSSAGGDEPPTKESLRARIHALKGRTKGFGEIGEQLRTLEASLHTTPLREVAKGVAFFETQLREIKKVVAETRSQTSVATRKRRTRREITASQAFHPRSARSRSLTDTQESGTAFDPESPKEKE